MRRLEGGPHYVMQWQELRPTPAIRSARLKFKSTNQISATGQNWVFIRHWYLRSVIGCAKQEKLHEVLIERARKIFSMAWNVVFCFVLLILPSSRHSTATISIDRFTALFCFRLNDQYIVIFAAWGSQWRLRRFGRLVVQFMDSFCLHSGFGICFSNCS